MHTLENQQANIFSTLIFSMFVLQGGQQRDLTLSPEEKIKLLSFLRSESPVMRVWIDASFFFEIKIYCKSLLQWIITTICLIFPHYKIIDLLTFT